jgi:tRNA 2-thiouridine synthesizing protein B
MSSLHIVSTSAYCTDALQRAVEMARCGDAIILIEDGVYGAADTPANQAVLKHCSSDVALFVLVEDLTARALPACSEQFKTIGYSGFVELVCHHKNSVSWS